MNEYRITRKCSICNQEKECSATVFVPAGENKVKLKQYMGINDMPLPNEFTLYACDDCGAEKGKKPTTAWFFALLGNLMLILAIVLPIALGSQMEGDTPIFLGLGLGMNGWIIAMIAGCVLMAKTRFNSHNNAYGAIMSQIAPYVGMIVLLKNRSKINRCACANTALKPLAEGYQQSEKQKDEEMTRLQESGRELTEEEQKRVSEWAKEKESKEQQAEYAKEEAQEQVKKNNFRSAIFGIIFTIIIGIYGASVYSSGRGVMSWFGVIDLSPTTFAIVIVLLLIWDIITLAKAIKDRNK